MSEPPALSLAPLPPAVTRGWGTALLGLVLSLVFTGLLFLGIARFDLKDAPAPTAEIAELRAVAVEEPPPPPPPVVRDEAPTATALTGIEMVPSSSPVQIAVAPPDLEALMPPTTQPPPAVIQIGQLYSNFKPKIEGENFRERIYQLGEVDQPPRVLNRVSPLVPPVVRKGASQLKTVIFFIVDANGEIRNPRIGISSGNPRYDALMIEALKEWSFTPAIRRNQKVRVQASQTFTTKFDTSVLGN